MQAFCLNQPFSLTVVSWWRVISIVENPQMVRFNCQYFIGNCIDFDELYQLELYHILGWRWNNHGLDIRSLLEDPVSLAHFRQLSLTRVAHWGPMLRHCRCQWSKELQSLWFCLARWPVWISLRVHPPVLFNSCHWISEAQWYKKLEFKSGGPSLGTRSVWCTARWSCVRYWDSGEQFSRWETTEAMLQLRALAVSGTVTRLLKLDLSFVIIHRKFYRMLKAIKYRMIDK
jgi:hypothetical protein